MNNDFERDFSEIQADMVLICKEYINNMGDNIFIHIIYQDDVISPNFFFKLNGKLYKKHDINNSGLTNFDISFERQKTALKILGDDMRKIIQVCEKKQKPVPVEMKIVYDIKQNSLKANYSYEKVLSEQKNDRVVFGEWFKELDI